MTLNFCHPLYSCNVNCSGQFSHNLVFKQSRTAHQDRCAVSYDHNSTFRHKTMQHVSEKSEVLSNVQSNCCLFRNIQIFYTIVSFHLDKCIPFPKMWLLFYNLCTIKRNVCHWMEWSSVSNNRNNICWGEWTNHQWFFIEYPSSDKWSKY